MSIDHPSDAPQGQSASRLKQANQVIAAWQHSAEEILQDYHTALGKIHTEKGTLADEFEFHTYPAIHKNLKLPDGMCFGDQCALVTVAIQFQNKPRNVLRLFLSAIGEIETPQQLYAELQYQFGRPIAVLQEDLNADPSEAIARFKAWFSQVMETMFKSWLDT